MINDSLLIKMIENDQKNMALSDGNNAYVMQDLTLNNPNQIKLKSYEMAYIYFVHITTDNEEFSLNIQSARDSANYNQTNMFLGQNLDDRDNTNYYSNQITGHVNDITISRESRGIQFFIKMLKITRQNQPITKV